ncbi:MAG TPA: hypothetical protein VFO03_00655 [Gaiellaceae bacterium]|nr:hypothetical protein [Gaiellaceae bacterium]
MATATRQTAQLTDEQEAELLQLVKGADSVELKLTIPESNQRSTAGALQLDPLGGQIRQVFFFDTPGLDLDRAGVVVRARRIQGKRSDTVVKLRPVVPDELPDDVRKSRNLVVEVDAIPGGFVCSATMKDRLSAADIRAAVLGERPIRRLFSKEQRRFFRAHADVDLDSLSILGPVFALKLKTQPKGLGRPLVAELWLYPDGSRILELSTKCAPTEPFQVAAEARAFLAEKGIDVTGEQQMKTRKALQFFAKELQATEGG